MPDPESPLWVQVGLFWTEGYSLVEEIRTRSALGMSVMFSPALRGDFYVIVAPITMAWCGK